MGLVNIFKGFFRKFFGESSIHGFPYVVQREFHPLERLAWLFVIMFSSFCAFSVFSDQLKRYNENPTVLSIEILSIGEFRRPSFTLCTNNFTDFDRAEQLVEEIWNVNASSPDFQLYVDFVEAISLTNYSNMGNLKPFANMSKFKSVDLLFIAREMRTQLQLTSAQFSHVMTEAGLCQSSSKYYYLQNPYFKDSIASEENIPMEEVGICSSLEVCRSSISPNNPLPNSTNTIFVHNYDEVASGDSIDLAKLNGTIIAEWVVKIDQIIAVEKLINLKAKSRKCLFSSEPQSKYFNVYSTNLCKIDCRIKSALKLCNCIPFFYTVPKVKVCDVDGMLCLAGPSNNNTWYDTRDCECMNLCETTIMTKVSSKEQDLKFDRMLTIDLVFPKTRIKRSVLFDFEDLIVGFGGSVALFLGFSFLTGVELVYFVIEYCLELSINLVKSHIIDRITEPTLSRTFR